MVLLFSITDTLSQPWPWYLAGILIATTMALMLFSGKRFGISSTFRAACTIMGAGKRFEFFNFDWKSAQGWNLVLVGGVVVGGMLAGLLLPDPQPMEIGTRTAEYIHNIGLSTPAETGPGMIPKEFSDPNFVFSWKGLIFLVLGGFLVGFGTRWAGGCTSGHAISGLSELQLPSLIAVIGFFAGGLLMTWVLMPLIF